MHHFFTPIIYILRILNKRISLIKPLILLVSLYPGALLYYRYSTDQLDINGLEDLLHTTGYWGMIIFIMVLSITPLRRMCSFLMILSKEPYGKRLSDWNWMIKLRRMLGVVSFLYACTHFYIFYYFELDTDFSELVYEVQEKPFILMGIASIIMLFPLFLTSNNISMKLLKKNWRLLHRLMYPISIAIIAHYIWLSKAGIYDPYPYAAIVIFLLLFRVMGHYKLVFNRKDDGMESKR